VHEYPATLAGAAFLPFTILMAGLSRWAGGLLDRFGARVPLVIGPAIAALGIGMIAVTVTNGSYWQLGGCCGQLDRRNAIYWGIGR
jgi:MFS family permease